MKRIGFFCVLFVLILNCSFLKATPHAINVIDYQTNAVEPWDNPLETLGAPDAMAEPTAYGQYSIGVSGWIILQLDQPVFDIEGPDLIVWEECTYSLPGAPDEAAYVYLGFNDETWTLVGKVDRGSRESMYIDIAGTQTSGSTYVMIVDDGMEYSHNGFELDAVTIIPEPSTILLLGLGGLALRRKMRR